MIRAEEATHDKQNPEDIEEHVSRLTSEDQWADACIDMVRLTVKQMSR